jgi:hypothetical protein
VTPARPDSRGTREKQETTATEDIPETRAARATPEIKAGRDSLGMRAARARPESRAETAMPHHAQQASIAIGTRILAERAASETKNLRGGILPLSPGSEIAISNNPRAWAQLTAASAFTS